MMDQITIQLLLDILENRSINVNDLKMRYGLSFKMIEAKLEALNHYLEKEGFPTIQLQNGVFMYDECSDFRILGVETLLNKV